MNESKIWLSSPHMGGNENKYVQEAFDTNWIAPLGPNVNGFEKDIEESDVVLYVLQLIPPSVGICHWLIVPVYPEANTVPSPS